MGNCVLRLSILISNENTYLLYNIEATDGRFQLLMPLFLLAIMRLQFVTWALAPSAPSAYVMRAIHMTSL